MSGRAIRLVLDTSAVIAYGRGSDDVGETISQVDENGSAFTVPVVCLAEATRSAKIEWVELLVSHRAFRPVDVDRVGAATALVATSDEDCDILTAEPDLYRVLGEDPPIVRI